MGPADLDDVLELVRLGLQPRRQLFQTRQQHVARGHGGGDVHGGREGVVGRLAHVAVVVGVDGGFGPHLAAEDFNRAVGDDLVRVHVGLRARSGLPDDQRKMIVELARDHF